MSMPPPPPPGGDQPPPTWRSTTPPPPPGPTAYQQFAQVGQVREHPQGTTILVLGILSLVICGLLGPFAWSMGNKALREIDSSGGLWTNRGNVTAGRICGIVSTCLLVVAVVVGILFFLLVATSTTR